MLSEKMKNSLRNLLAFVFLFAMGYFFLMGSQTQTPEEFDQEFIAKYDACILRAKK
jgi:preprotein translocase subunit YajC